MAKRIKNLTFTLKVEVTVACTEPESFKNDEEFLKQDGGDMIKYVKEKIGYYLQDTYNCAAEVSRLKITKMRK